MGVILSSIFKPFNFSFGTFFEIQKLLGPISCTH
jgi:hypothetical protein